MHYAASSVYIHEPVILLKSRNDGVTKSPADDEVAALKFSRHLVGQSR
jgi:hypothetical protein